MSIDCHTCVLLMTLEVPVHLHLGCEVGGLCSLNAALRGSQLA